MLTPGKEHWAEMFGITGCPHFQMLTGSWLLHTYFSLLASRGMRVWNSWCGLPLSSRSGLRNHPLCAIHPSEVGWMSIRGRLGRAEIIGNRLAWWRGGQRYSSVYPGGGQDCGPLVSRAWGFSRSTQATMRGAAHFLQPSLSSAGHWVGPEPVHPLVLP